MSKKQASSFNDEELLHGLSLSYVLEDPPGITRVKRGRGFSFLNPDGSIIRSALERQRLQNIAVPPTYINVWYCPLENGHLQATGFDSTEKKQYFYHPLWTRIRDLKKFGYMAVLGEKLPGFRRTISREMSSEQPEQTRVLSAMARILDRTGMRIGNDAATEKNNTHGLTTLTKAHLVQEDDAIELVYEGKGGAKQRKRITDASVLEVIDECAEIPGQRLFEYRNEQGTKVAVDSGELNAFLKSHLGDSVSAKDFRTWRFSCQFLSEALRQKRQEERVTLKSVLQAVAEMSGNTPAILQSSYVHPGLLAAVKDDDFEWLEIDEPVKAGLRKDENRFYNYLKTALADKAIGLET